MGQTADRNATGQSAAGTPMKPAERKFVMDAAEGGMAEVELGKLAKDKGSSEGVKQFGQRMVDDHGKANDELKKIASSKSITLPDAPAAKHKATMDRLSKLSGADFDRAYIKEMVKDHEQDVKEFQHESQSGSDSDIKEFAAKTLPTLQDHLKQIKELESGNKGTTPSSADRSKQ
jgi:putative membrane protein